MALRWKRSDKPSLQKSNGPQTYRMKTATVPYKLSMQLRAAEDRINQLESEVQLFRERAARAEGWLQTIHKEIEEKLITPRLVSRTEQRSLP